MASADYKLCDKCRCKVFYDADISYSEEYCKDVDEGRIVALCRKCAETHKIVIINIDSEIVAPIEPTGPMILYGIHAHEKNDDLPNIGFGPKCVAIYKHMISGLK